MQSVRLLSLCLRNVKLKVDVKLPLSSASLHTSSQLCMASKRKNMKRKFNRPVVHKPKALNADGEVIDIWQNMTVTQLASSMQKDLEHVFEVMMYIDHADYYDKPQSEITNFAVLKEIIKKSGMRYRMKDLKVSKELEFVDRDAVEEPRGELRKRPPIVTIMGHVDHGKTTLLDYLHKTNVVQGEFGGITQHIGAFTVKLDALDEHITFLDTPGHAAFSAMRGRGAKITDIIVLVVAVDDGVMQQTAECIEHARNERVPIIVALNKADKAPGRIEDVKRELLQHGVQLEDFGGDIQAIPISALKGTNIDELEEAIIALGEILELRADYQGQINGHIIEAKFSPGRGKLATVLIEDGTLRKGDILTAGNAWCKVRGLFSDDGKPVREAEPGRAVEIIGWRELPAAGDRVLSVPNEKRAKEVIEYRLSKKRDIHESESKQRSEEKAAIHDKDYKTRRQVQLDKGYRRSSIYRKERIPESTSCDKPKLPIVLKGDVDGSVEVILDALDTYDADDQCILSILQYGVGDVTLQDVDMASHFNGIVYAFNVSVSSVVKEKAEELNVQILSFNVIYRFIESLKQQLTERMPTIEQKEIIGEANVQQIFVISTGKRKLQVAGCRCSKGQLIKKQRFTLMRQGELIYDGKWSTKSYVLGAYLPPQGKLSSLKHFKNEVDSIKLDVECGLSLDDPSVQLQRGDVVQCYVNNTIKQKLSWDPEHF